MKSRPAIPAEQAPVIKPDRRAVRALVRLTEALSTAFSAASEEERGILTSPETVTELEAMAASAGIPVAKIAEYSVAAREAIAAMREADGIGGPGLRYRREMSRLFYRPPRMAVLEGRKWVSPKRRTGESLAMGERAAVAREYARQGLRVVPGAGEAEDCLQYELEYMAWLINGEAAALEAGNTAEMLRLRGLRRHFVDHHLEEFCRGVSAFVEDHSDDPVLLFYARLLDLVALRLKE
ncbi:MAG: molecular chaperone TorD family protein [Eggerthellaceae bacterium]|nr:molecular chaperone TorD family protein [Eggerthellaceae bacterium]